MLPSTGLYLDDAYARSFEARVLDVTDDCVVLDRTAFCPGEGGQLPDRGWLRWGDDSASVAKVGANAGVFRHYLDNESIRPRIGQNITGELDWTYRHRMMRTHTAYHVLSAIAFHLSGARTTQSEVVTNGLRVNFKTDCWSDELAADIEYRTNQVISANLPIYTYALTRAEARDTPLLNRLKVDLLPAWVNHVRVVEIEGIALDVDTGTHVRTTREIGHVQIARIKMVEQHRYQVEFRINQKATPKATWLGATAEQDAAAIPSKHVGSAAKSNRFTI